MNKLADAIVYAVAYIDIRSTDDQLEDDDVDALESIAADIQEASPQELDALADATQRALQQEVNSTQPRQEFVDAYRCWMENILVIGWTENARDSES